jgi:5'-nucleotidase
MDGVLTDLHSHIRTLTGKHPNQYSSPDEMWEAAQQFPNLFADPPEFTSMCLFALRVSRSYQTFILTAKPRRGGFPTIVADKTNWVEDRFGRNIPVIVCEHAHDKTSVIRSDQSVRQILIDDLESNCQRWEAAGGLAIHHQDYSSTRDQLLKILNC